MRPSGYRLRAPPHNEWPDMGHSPRSNLEPSPQGHRAMRTPPVPWCHALATRRDLRERVRRRKQARPACSRHDLGLGSDPRPGARRSPPGRDPPSEWPASQHRQRHRRPGCCSRLSERGPRAQARRSARPPAASGRERAALRSSGHAEWRPITSHPPRPARAAHRPLDAHLAGPLRSGAHRVPVAFLASAGAETSPAASSPRDPAAAGAARRVPRPPSPAIPACRPGSPDGADQASASSMKGWRVKITGPSLVTSRFSSRRTVCSSPGCPAKVSHAKYMFSSSSTG